MLRSRTTISNGFKRAIKPKLKTITSFTPQVRSMHPSHRVLKGTLNKVKARVIVRLGSTTTTQEAYPTKTAEQLSKVIEINTVQAIKNSASKLLMKQCFTRAGVKTAQWYTANRVDNFSAHNNNGNSYNSVSTGISQLPYPIIAKSLYGSRGEGNTKLDNQQQLEAWIRDKVLSNYIFEKFYTYSKEYRIHVTNDGCFYTCRKLLRNDTPESEQWHRHDENSVWIVEENPAFKKPTNWNDIVADCISAKNALGLDICAFDVKTQGSLKTNPEWIILESCSAPSFGEITAIKYKEELNKLISQKVNG
jgi:hypothetical protein